MADLKGFSVELKMIGHSGKGFFRTLDKFMYKEFLKAQEDIKKRLLKTAREDHKYTHQTRNLRNSTKVKGQLIHKKGLELYVDFKKARYAGYIITGERNDPRYGKVKVKHGPDPFLDNAMKVNEAWIEKRIAKAVNNAVIRWNRLK